MSRSGFSRSAAGDATRQKLDALDALIQQMLNLPVNRLDPEWPVAVGQAEDSEQKTEDRGRRIEDKVQGTEDGGQKTEDSGQRTEDGEGKVEAPGREPKAEDEGRETDESGEVAEGDGQSQRGVPSSVLPSSSPWWLYPVLGLNLLFDGLTFLLGPVGRWLRGETGRLLVGWVGVALVLAGLAWAFLGWMGWIN